MAGGFDSLGLMPELLRGIDELDWILPTDIQDEAIPLILGGGDVMAAAETGSGKTAAFCLPMLQCVYERLRELSTSSGSSQNKGSGAGSGPGPDSGVDALHVRFNVDDKDNMLLVSADGCEATGQAEKQWTGARATHGVRSGKFYYEAHVQSKGICRVGFSTMAAHHELGRDAHGFGYGGTGMKSFMNTFEAYGEPYGEGDVIGCLLDMTSHPPSIHFSKNGKALGRAFSLSEEHASSVLFPACVLKGATIKINFGQTPFLCLPHGFRGISAGDASSVVSSSNKEAFVVTGKRAPLAIILEPARDLAEQVFHAIEEMSRYIVEPELKTMLLIGGGDDRNKQIQALKKGVDIVVGTTGKVCDLLKSGALSLSQIKFFILDEADRMVEDSQSLADVMQLYAACPGGGTGDNRLQVCFFSATLHSPQIRSLAERICVNPTWVDLKGVESVPETVHHVVYKVQLQRDAHLLGTARTASVTDDVHDASDASLSQSPASLQLKRLKQQILLGIIDRFEMSQCIIFCRTNLDCDNLESFLTTHGGGNKFRGRVESGKEHKYSCCVLAGMRSMNERRAALESFKDGEVRFLICTDVAARGIDIKNLPYVINMTLPDEAENYIHRIGRVGRAERMGLAISIVAGEGAGGTAAPVKEKVWYHKCKDRGKGCTNRKTAEQGGCTIWNDEAAMLRAVEKRLHLPAGIPELNVDFSLPQAIADLKVEYGEMDVSGGAPAGGRATLHLDLLRPTVAELGRMEVTAQSAFHSLQTRFGRFETNDEAFLRVNAARDK
jgi:ATP-dependent RNA helicase DDX1